MPEIERYVGYEELDPYYPGGRKPTRKHLLDLMKRGLFPASYQISPNRTAWKLSELVAHAAALPVAKSIAKAAADRVVADHRGHTDHVDTVTGRKLITKPTARSVETLSNQ